MDSSSSSFGGNMNSRNYDNQAEFSFSAQLMNSSSFTDLLAQPDNNDFGSNWAFDLQNSKPKSSTFHNSSALPFSPTNLSPSSFLSIFDSPPIQPSTSNVTFTCNFYSLISSLSFFLIYPLISFFCLCRFCHLQQMGTLMLMF